MANYHLAILKKPYLDLILEGRKTVESRFLKVRKEPLGKVSVGDVLFLKESSGPVCGKAVVSAVKSYENLTLARMDELKRRYNHLICGDDEYWKKKNDCGFGVLVWLAEVQRIEPVWISKKDWRGWVVLTKRENFGLLQTQDAICKTKDQRHQI